jgi:hypothetical protein
VSAYFSESRGNFTDGAQLGGIQLRAQRFNTPSEPEQFIDDRTQHQQQHSRSQGPHLHCAATLRHPFPHRQPKEDHAMPVYLIQPKNSTEPPRLWFGKDAHDACALIGLDPAECIVRDVTKRTLQPHHINNAPLTADFLEDSRDD